MKTPKRYPATMSVYATRDELQQDRARWKRKNRVKQLKRSLEKYKDGTHLRGDVGAAYRILQCLVHPGKKAPLTEWLTFMRELQIVQTRIQDAIANATYFIKVKAEREAKDRKVQE